MGSTEDKQKFLSLILAFIQSETNNPSFHIQILECNHWQSSRIFCIAFKIIMLKNLLIIAKMPKEYFFKMIDLLRWMHNNLAPMYRNLIVSMISQLITITLESVLTFLRPIINQMLTDTKSHGLINILRHFRIL